LCAYGIQQKSVPVTFADRIVAVDVARQADALLRGASKPVYSPPINPSVCSKAGAFTADPSEEF
jgi:hypothetical protein